jgi:hypothetical protein
MFNSKDLVSIGVVVGVGFSGYHAGKDLRFAPQPAQQTLTIASAASTSATHSVMFNTITFAQLPAIPPVRSTETSQG